MPPVEQTAAVVEAPSHVGVDRNEVRRERLEWRMPKVEPGTPIIWYAGNKPDKKPYVGTVARVMRKPNQTIVAHVPGHPGSEFVFKCHHVSDPLLKLGADIASEGGCWQFSPFYREYLERSAELERRMSDLERRMDQATPVKSNATLKSRASRAVTDEKE